MKKNKTNRVIILSSIFTIMIVSLIIFVLNYTKDSSSFSIIEKNWINKNKNNVIDISTYNDVPIYGYNGEGIIFSFLEDFSKDYGISFNRVSYFSDNNGNLKDSAFRILNYNDELSDNDILMYEDEYVIVSKEDKLLDDIRNIDSAKLGVFNNDISSVSYYLYGVNNISYVPYDNIDDLINSMVDGNVEYIALPNVMYMDDILANDLNIVYHISELKKQYVLTVNNNSTLLSIMKKYNNIYKDRDYDNDYKDNFLKMFFKSKNFSEEESRNYNSSVYNYGYVVNMPFENTVNKEFVGTLSNYLNGFIDLVDVDIKITEYDSINELKKALSNGEVDLTFANYKTDGLRVDTLLTSSLFKEEYVVLSKNSYIVNSIRSLKGKTVNVVENSYLHSYLLNNSIAVKSYKNTDDLLRNIDNDSIVIMDYDTYNYYKDKKFGKYNIIYQGVLDDEYRFVVRDVSKNKTFYELFNYYVGIINYKDIRYDYNTDYILNSQSNWNILIRTLFIILGITILLVVLLFLLLNRKNRKEKLKKENKMKFIDVMTSLKNRNYLNYNIKKWDDNVIYPQAILIIDLNNIKTINDSHGHEEGDMVIKKAAGVLLNSQMENTDIIRTDGNEFLVYMVGYDEKSVIEYTRKLSKELKKLPYEYGASLGYSMIFDDVKTIDDAINEATILMREAKDKDR